MKRFLALLIMSAILFSGQYCKKSNGSGNSGNNNNPKPTPTSVGTPTGTLTSKFISPSGGSIASADGKLEIDFPNGALPAGDTITIQPITNNCPGGMGLAYRMGPDGSKFSQPVTLKFHYDDSLLNETSQELMMLAYQDKSGIWFALDNAQNDTINHVISGTTTHFTDFTWFESVSLSPRSASLKVGDHISLNVQITATQQELDQSGNSGYALLKGNSSTWTVNDVTNGNDEYGKITPVPSTGAQLYDYVTYTAPNSVPPQGKNPVLVKAEFDQLFLRRTSDGHIEAESKIFLTARINIYDITYHVEINFKADSVSESGAYWTWTDHGSFDVVSGGTTDSVTNINNSEAAVQLISNTSTCDVSVSSTGEGPIQIQDSGFAVSNPFAKIIVVTFNRSLNPVYYISYPEWTYTCPGGGSGKLGGGTGPSFPTYVQFNIDSVNVQTITSGQYTITVSPQK